MYRDLPTFLDSSITSSRDDLCSLPNLGHLESPRQPGMTADFSSLLEILRRSPFSRHCKLRIGCYHRFFEFEPLELKISMDLTYRCFLLFAAFTDDPARILRNTPVSSTSNTGQRGEAAGIVRRRKNQSDDRYWPVYRVAFLFRKTFHLFSTKRNICKGVRGCAAWEDAARERSAAMRPAVVDSILSRLTDVVAGRYPFHPPLYVSRVVWCSLFAFTRERNESYDRYQPRLLRSSYGAF